MLAEMSETFEENKLPIRDTGNYDNQLETQDIHEHENKKVIYSRDNCHLSRDEKHHIPKIIYTREDSGIYENHDMVRQFHLVRMSYPPICESDSDSESGISSIIGHIGMLIL